jgi:hypothetical protein
MRASAGATRWQMALTSATAHFGDQASNSHTDSRRAVPPNTGVRGHRVDIARAAMPKFVLIDHSLKDLGGHTAHTPITYWQRRAGRLATCAGNPPPLRAADRPASRLASACAIHSRVTRHTLDTQAQLNARPPGASADRWGARANGGRRHAHGSRHGARDCASSSSSNLSAVVIWYSLRPPRNRLIRPPAFLARSGVGLDSDWHLQFILACLGANPTTPHRHSRGGGTRFVRSLGQSGPQRLHFYCTTEQLTAQYRRLGSSP